MRKIIVAVLIVLIAAGAWWYASPIWTLRAMQNAAKAHDAARLSGYVDYPALREDLKGDLGAYVMRESAGAPQDGGAKLGAAIALAFLGPVVDAIVTPQGVAAMFAQQGKDAKAVPVTTGDHPVIERDGLDSFRVHGEDASKGSLVFRRAGLGWKLVGVDLPQR
jgi:hypothetical protein